jgi:hypothetical protein
VQRRNIFQLYNVGNGTLWASERKAHCGTRSEKEIVVNRDRFGNWEIKEFCKNVMSPWFNYVHTNSHIKEYFCSIHVTYLNPSNQTVHSNRVEGVVVFAHILWVVVFRKHRNNLNYIDNGSIPVNSSSFYVHHSINSMSAFFQRCVGTNRSFADVVRGTTGKSSNMTDAVRQPTVSGKW